MVLDNLKDVWKNQKENTIQFSETDIYKMIHKRSTSIVKWIFYISIIEFVLFMLPNFLIDSSENIEKFHLINFVNISIIISIIIGLVFIFLFYKNYKRICVSDSTKKLMRNILKTKKITTYYILIQLSSVAIYTFIISFKSIKSLEVANNLNITIWFLIIVVMIFIIALFWLFYKLLYGILLNRLKENYKELQKNE